VNPKILEQVPPDYYDKGMKTNLFQWIWHTWKWQSLKSLIRDLKGEVLDIGCADGTITEKIDSFLPQAKLTGLDLYQKAIEYARKKRPQINFVCANARKMPFKNNQFDAIICIETLEHVPNNQKVIKEIQRCLKDSGTLIVAQDTNNWLFKFVWFIWIKWKGKVWKNAHVNSLKPKELISLLEKNGFKILEKKTSHLGMEILLKAKSKKSLRL
jgi:ubiquinone/menaquinone biosynthesis C-methylase UbiE